jgi:CRISPR-associated endonuclease/helicase Cas3
LAAVCGILRELRACYTGWPRSNAITAHAEWLAALHDIGKMTPVFQDKIHEALGKPLNYNLTEAKGGHARDSEVILAEMFGKEFAELAGAHHGSRDWDLDCSDFIRADRFGGSEWADARAKMIECLKTELKLPECDLKQCASANHELILGVTILSDWLGSGMELPPGAPPPTASRCREVIRDAGLLPFSIKKGLSFNELFGFEPNALQQAIPAAVPGGIYVIESGMGSGKTEAALRVAYQLLESNQANGVYFAMPTRLTSEKIYDRLDSFLKKIIEGDGKGINMLIHGEAYLDWELPQPTDNGFDTELSTGSWFQSKKRALLAPFGAGTVDQALLAVIRARHNALRAFALSGKVVIIDEVHSYDAYTSTLIQELSKRLQEWGATVVILSATLTREAREKLIGHEPHESGYPLLTIANAGSATETPIHSNDARAIAISHAVSDADAHGQAIERAINGEQVLWIDNTVAKAQETYKSLMAICPANIEIGLIHSRFPSKIRREQEHCWVDLLGKNGGEARRRRGRILVATQILEQSVDVDADFMVSRLAPCDMLFQRLGRLRRHPSLNGFRPSSAQPQALLLEDEIFADVDALQKNDGATLPYDAYWMWRTYQVWRDLTEVSLPGFIRPMLEEVYADRVETNAAKQLHDKMMKKLETSQNLARQARASHGEVMDDDRAALGTRLSDEEEAQVLLLRKGNRGIPLDRALCSIFEDEPIVVPGRDGKVAFAKKILPLMVKVRQSLAPDYNEFNLDFLKPLLWMGNDGFHPVRAAYIDETGHLLSKDCRPLQHKKKLRYHDKLGYLAQ